MSKSKCITKRLLAVVLTVLMLMSMVTIGITSASAATVELAETGATPTTLYLMPSDGWKSDGARFAAYFFGNGETWVSMTDSDGDGIYEVAVPTGYPNVIFGRMNPATTENNWDTKWNQTGDLTIPTDGKNLFTVPSEPWDGATTTWSIYTPTGDGGETGGDTGGTVVADGFPGGTVLYLQPGVWTEANARFAAYFCNGSSAATWIDMTDADGDGYYEVTVPDDSNHKNVIFVRMNPAATANNWDNKWNQTADLAYVADNNLFSISAWGPEGGTSPGAWSVYEGGSGGSTVTGTGWWVDTNPIHGVDTLKKGEVPIDWVAKNSDGNLYLPSNVNIDEVVFCYSGPEGTTLEINGTTVENGGTYKLEAEKSYTLGGSFSGTFTVLQSANVSTMYTYTSTKMPTTTGAYSNKDAYSVEKGSIMVASPDGTIRTVYTEEAEDGTETEYEGDTLLKKIKGRGNSSWNASYEEYGKYAFNITLDEKNKLIDGAKSNKKYCLLANNADEARMRNMVIYSLSEAIGLEFVADFEVMDVYNNNKYIGSYLLTEKVEIGNPLVNLTNADGEKVNLDDINEEFFGEDSEGDAYYGQSQFRGCSNGNLDYNGSSEYIKYYDYSSLGLGDVDPAVYADTGFLLELELNERFAAEVSGFISSKGQHVVCKYPEYATKAQIEFISEFWNDAEAVIYSTDPTYDALDEYIDVESFAKMYLIQELSKNLDGCATSYYVYYNEGKLHAGVTWDYDWTLGQALATRSYKQGDFSPVSGDMHSETGWWMNSRTIYKKDSSTDVYNIQAQLCQGEHFWDVVEAEWNELFYDAASEYVIDIGSTASIDLLTDGIISEYYSLMKDSIAMDETKWGFIKDDPIGPGTNWNNTADTGDTFGAAVVWLNDYIYDRLTWMNTNDGNTSLGGADYTIQAPVVKADKEAYTEGDTVTLTITDKSSGSFKYILNDEEITLTDGVYTTVADTAVLAYTVKAVSTTTGVESNEATVNVTVEEETCAHTNVEPIPAVDATCTETGLSEGTKCSDCGKVLVEQEVTEKLPHTEVIDKAVAATCTETGLTEGKHCDVCGEVIIAQDVVDALGHNMVDGTCTVCGTVCEHTWEDGTCTSCGTVCEHEWTDGVCGICGTVCDHTWEDGTCTVCGTVCGHEWTDGICDTCGKVCEHAWTDGICGTCGMICEHTWEEGTCTVCGTACEHEWTDDVCDICGTVCEHTWEDGTCTVCGTVCAHTWTNGVCDICAKVCEHEYENGYCTICGAEDIPAELTGNSVTLGGNIGVNFYYDIKESAQNEGTYVEFTIPNGNTRKVFFNDAVETEHGYMFTCEVAAKEMTAVIKAQLVSSNGSRSEKEACSVKEYAHNILADAEYVAAYDLVKAMLNYGAAAQVHFKYNPDNLANADLPEADKVVAKADFAKYQYVLTGKLDGVKYYGSKLTLESETAIKHYFKITGEVPTFTLNGEALEVNEVNGLYEIKIADINAKALGEKVEVVVGDNAMTLDYNAFSYGLLASDIDDADLNAVMDALYAYNQAALAYPG